MKRLTFVYAFGALIVMIAVIGCGSGQESAPRSVEEIHRSEGVPVNVRAVDRGTFRTFLTFTSSLTGAEESTATSLVTDEVAQVRYSVGDFVESGEPVVLFPPDNPTLNYEQAKLSYEAAGQTYERTRRVFQEDGVSQQDLDNAKTQLDIAKANWESLQKMTAVPAPISGYITRINVLESDNVEQGDELFTVSDYDELKSTVWLTDRQVEKVRVGQRATAHWQDHTLYGVVVQVDMSMDQSRKAFAAKMRFRNPGRVVLSGVTATLRIQTHNSDDVIIVRETETRMDELGYYLFVVEDSRARRQHITIGLRQGLYVTVTGGLAPGMQVITDGIDQMSDGTLVKIIERKPRLVQRQD